MGKRSEPRKDIQVPVRIFGTDAAGAVFSQKAVTVNISRTGVELAGVQSQISIDEIIGLSYGANRVHFRVRWVGKTNTPKAGHVGLRSVSPENPSGTSPSILPAKILTNLVLPSAASIRATAARIPLKFTFTTERLSGARLPISAWAAATPRWRSLYRQVQS